MGRKLIREGYLVLYGYTKRGVNLCVRPKGWMDFLKCSNKSRACMFILRVKRET